MDKLRLNEREIALYFDTFDAYDVAKQGHILLDEAFALFVQSGIPNETLHKIVEMCGVNPVGHFGRNQFFMALKLIALAQSGKDVSLEGLQHHGMCINRVKLIASSSFRFIHRPKSEFTRIQWIYALAGGKTNEFGTPLTDMDKIDEKYYKGPIVNATSKIIRDGWQPFGEEQEADEEDRGLLQSPIDAREACSWSSGGSNSPTEEQSTEPPSDWTLLHRPFSELETFPSGSSTTATTEMPTPVIATNPDWNYRQFDAHSLANNHVLSGDESTPSQGGCVMRDQTIAERSHHPPPSSNGTLLQQQQSFELKDPRRLHQFCLDAKREKGYARQFESLLKTHNGSLRTSRPMVALFDVERLFTLQYQLSPDVVLQIWRLADRDRDNHLDKFEFCLASHLAYLHGHKGVALDEAVHSTASYISRRMPAIRKQDSMQSTLVDTWPILDPPPLSPTTQMDGDASDDDGDDDGDDNDAESEFYPDERDGEVALLGRDRVLPPTLGLQRHGILEAILANQRLSARSSRNSSAGSSINKNDSPIGSVEFHSPPRCCPSVPSCSNSSASSSSSVSSSHESSPTSSGSSSSASTSSASSSFLSNFSSSETDSGGEQGLCTPSRVVNGRIGVRKGKKRIDPIQLLAISTGRPPSKLTHYSGTHRRRLFAGLIREAKTVNHILLRLNNEMQGEWTDLKDQRVNLSAQLRHLGLQPPT